MSCLPRSGPRPQRRDSQLEDETLCRDLVRAIASLNRGSPLSDAGRKLVEEGGSLRRR
jgi:hypothetical protein